MVFASALFSLMRGYKIRRRNWVGYWELVDGEVMMYCKDGRVLNIRESDDILFTLENIACDDWEIVPSDKIKEYESSLDPSIIKDIDNVKLERGHLCI